MKTALIIISVYLTLCLISKEQEVRTLKKAVFLEENYCPELIAKINKEWTEVLHKTNRAWQKEIVKKVMEP